MVRIPSRKAIKPPIPPDGFTSDVTWSSSDPSILEIDPVTGEATGVYPGKVTIWAVDKEGHVASKDVTVTRDEQNGAWVYVYTKVVYNGLDLSATSEGRAKAQELGLSVNGHGWFTLGKVWVNGIKNPTSEGVHDTEYQQKTIANLSRVERFNANGNINFDDITWKDYVGSADGADNYVGNGTWTWHLDGQVDIKSMTKVNVHYVEKGTGKELGSDQITTTVGKEFDPASQKRDFEGYSFDSADAAFVPEEGQVKDVYLYYTKGTFPYTVKYVDKETGEELHASATHGGEYGADVTEDALDIKGYEPDAAQKTLKIGTDGNTITFYYTKKAVDYTVNYYVNRTTEKVADSQTISGAKYGDTVTADQPAFDGYTLVPNQTPTITLSEEAHEINVYYYKNVELTANSDTREYNGEEQSVSGFTGAPEDADFSDISVGAKGTNAGTYPAKFPEGTEGTVDGSVKYIVTDAINGQLVISPVTDEVVVKIKGNTDSAKYDGKEHSVSGYKVESISNDALKEGDFALKSGVSASASGRNADTYKMGLNDGSFELSKGAASNFTNVRFEVEDGQLEIAKRKITLWSEDGHKNYDGAALQRRTDILVDGIKEVYNNDTDTTSGKVFQGDGFAEGEGIEGKTKTNWFNQYGQSDTTNIAPGVYDNKFTVAFKEGTNPENYDITYEYGKLYVNKRTEKDLYAINVAANSDSATYDGNEHSASGVTLTAANKKYSTSGMTFTNEKGIVFTVSGYSAEAKGTDAGDYASKVVANNVKVTDPSGNDVTDQFKFSTTDGKLTVSKKDAKIIAASAEKEYDGEALTTDGFTTKGFIEGQGIASATVEGSQTLVGSSESSIKKDSWKAKDGTNLNNYNVSTEPGTLTVTNRAAQYQVELQAKGGTKTYNGQEQSVSGLVSDTFTQNGKTYTVSGLTVGASGTDADTYTTTTTGTAKVADSKGNDVSAQFAVTVKPANLVINQKEVTLKSKSLSKEYDGTALTNGKNVLETEEGWVEGQGATYDFNGSRTEVGTTAGGNTFAVKANEGTNLNNYKVNQVAGDLTVTKNTSAVVVTITGKTVTEKYDGTTKRVEGYDVESSNPLYTSADFTFSGSQSVEGVDAGTYSLGLKAADFANTSKNFENVTFNVVSDSSLEIAKRKVALTSATPESKVYDGTPLFDHTVTPGGEDGFAEGDSFTAEVTGSQTDAGTSSNAFTYELTGNGAKKDAEGSYVNYDVAKTEGSLTVTPVADEVVVTITGHKGGQEYNGSEQTVSGYDVSASNNAYTSNDFLFSGTDSVSKTDAGTYSMGLKAEDFSSISKNFAKVTFSVEDGSLSIAKRGVTLVSQGNTWEYTGKTFSLPKVTVGGSGFVEGEASDIKATGSVRNVGDEQTNTITWAHGDNYKDSNYEIKKTEGVLRVIAGKNIADYVTLTPTDVEATYDGQPHAAGTAKAEDKNGGKLTIEYSTDGDDWTTNPAEITAKNVNDSRNGEEGKNAKVQVRVSSSNYQGYVTGEESITVNKRVVSLSSATDSKPYDGTALTRPDVSGWQQSGDAGFVTGEVSEVKATGSVTNVAEGEVNNTIEYTTAEGFSDSNYTITKNEGKLSITSGTGIAHVVTLNTAGLGHVYDGASHALPASNAKANDDSPLVIEYSVDGKNWTKDPSTITAVNVRDGKKVTVRVSSTNFSDVVTGEAQLSIVPRTVTVTSKTASKVYDGTPLTEAEVTVGANLFLSDEVTNVRATGSVTTVAEGQVTNTIAYDTTSKFIPENYNIIKTEGTLSITGQSIVPDPDHPDTYKGITIDDPSDSVYDGQEHKWAPVVKDANGNALKEGTDYTVSYNKGDFTNVTGDIAATITGIGNYAGATTKTYKITPAPLAVTTPSASKVYDGTALEAKTGTAENINGLVNGETATVKASGSQTEVGTSGNTYAGIEWGTASESNYTITSIGEGALNVTPKSVAAADMTVGQLKDVTYNGLEQAQEPEVKDGNTVLEKGKDYDLTFSNDVTNVGTVTVTVTGKGGYTGSTQVSYRINPATLTVTTPTASKAYDGTALTAAGSISGFVNNETATFTTTGSQITVGSSTNWYSIDWNGSAKKSNYQISENLGTLTVTESENEVVVTTTGETVTYDGAPHGATVTVTNLPVGYTAQATSNAQATDANGEGIAATADNLVIYNTNGEDVTAQLNIKRVDGTIKVLPKELSVTTPDASKVYDGEALTAEGSISGFVPGETAAFATTGSQTEVGDSQNTYSLTWNGNAKESNYTVAEQLGTLSVSRQTINPEDPENPKAYDGVQVSYPQDVTYDGKEHKWAPTVTSKKGAELVEGTDYTVAYDKSNFTDVTGEILVTITGIGNYSGSVTRTYKINPATYYVVTEGASKTYDGSALTAPGKVVGLVNGEEAALETTGSQTEVGSSENGYSLKFSKSAKESNYAHGTDSIGTLTVNAAKAEGNITLEGAPASKTYDGTALEAGVAKASASAGDSVTIEYSVDGQNWTTDPSTITATDVADSTTVQLRASSPKNYEGYVYGSEELTINQRAVNLVSESASKAFDGTPLTKPEVSGWQQSGDEGFVNGEVSGVRATGSVTYVAEGEVANTITFDKAASYKEGNYRVSTTKGTLRITGQTIVPDPSDPAYKGVTISDPADVEYDGGTHKWAPEVKDAQGNNLLEGTDYTVSYDTDDFANVKTIVVTITGIGNYTGTVAKSYRITPKELTVDTESASKVYDGTPLTAPGHITGLVAGETAEVNTPNSQTEVGSAFNLATSIIWGTAQERNYTWKIGEIGTLTVTPQSIVPDPENPESYKGITIDDPSDSVYDGQEHKWAPVVKDAAGNVLVEGRDYTVAYPAGQDFTNVTGAITATITGMGNYAGSVEKSYQITPAQLTVATGSAQKTYDGTPLTNSELKIEGLVGDDAVTARTTGSQTEVGSSTNTYEITWGNTRESNYAIAGEELGMLTVTEAPATPETPVTPGGNGGTVTPNNPGGGNPVLNNVARALEGNFNAITGANESAAAAMAGEQIYDEENPLGTTYEDACWVHFYIILGMILSGIYGLGVMFRRLNHIRRLRNDMNDVLGNGDGSDAEKAPAATTNPAGMEA